jgi:uncharacterized protein YigA (DUF484 family)
VKFKLPGKTNNMGKQNSFDDFIMRNKDAFDSQMPSDHLWDRIASEVNVPHSGKRQLWLNHAKRYAAVAVVLLSVSIGLHMVFFSSPDGEDMQASVMSKEINDVSYFYETEIERKREQVIALTAETPAIKEEIEMDFEALDIALIELKADLSDDVSNSEVLTAMIQNYRLKLQILEQILEFVEPTSPDNFTEDENYTYGL